MPKNKQYSSKYLIHLPFIEPDDTSTLVYCISDQELDILGHEILSWSIQKISLYIYICMYVYNCIFVACRLDDIYFKICFFNDLLANLLKNS